MGNLDDGRRETIKTAAALMVNNQPLGDGILPVIESQMLTLAETTPSTGGTGTVVWVATLKAFGEILISLAKQEEARLRHYKSNG